jgi:hypothetical protein
MSTFGKKALKWWDYNNNGDKLANQRFINTDIDLQLKIIEKWYPIGTKIQVWNWLLKRYSGDVWTIEKYEIVNNHWKIWIISETKYDNYHKTTLPTLCQPTPEERKKIIRNIKLNKIIDG